MFAPYWAPFGPRAAVSLALWVAVVAASGRAHASPSFPRVIDEALSLGCEPPCALCHKGDPGFGTTNTPFGMKMRREARLSCCDDGALEDALMLFQERGIDTDGDATPDVEELVAGTDPNGEGALACEQPELGDGSRILGEGCGVASPTRKPASGGASRDATAISLTALWLGLLVRLRTRRARQAS